MPVQYGKHFLELMMDMIEIDGSQGEGGGQILRTALSCGAMLSRPVRITRIRAKRDKPGLKRQHLTGARAVAEICSGRLTGDEVGSSELTLFPSAIRGGDYRFAIGTAGSVTLVAQTVIPVLLKAEKPSTVIIEGGTHVTGAPIFEFFNEVYLPQLRRMGCEVTATLERCGFYPAGGGRIRLCIEPLKSAKPYQLVTAGALKSAEVVGLFSGIPGKIAKDEVDIIAGYFEALNPTAKIKEVESASAGNAAYMRLEFENVTEVFSAIGALGLSRKAVAKEIVRRVRDYRKAGWPVGHFLADQLLLPIMHLGAGGSFATGPLSLHAKTNLEILKELPHPRQHEWRRARDGIIECEHVQSSATEGNQKGDEK